MPLPTAPTSELGQTGSSSGVPGLLSWTALAGDVTERVPELQWPMSNMTYALMLNDAQIDGLVLGSTLPIRRYNWLLDPKGADPQHVEELADDLNLSILGQETKRRRRSARRFKFGEHLFHALRAIVYGHYYFEQVGEDIDGRWHLRKLAPRTPESIAEIAIAEDGGLAHIKQNYGWNAPDIPVSRLVAYISDKEGANWAGRSMLRSCYRDWLVKDRLIRVNAINIERGGGIPVAETSDKNASPAQIARNAQMAQALKVGESAGGAMGPGATMRMLSPAGTSAVESIRMHNEEMARSFLMMFMGLGQGGNGGSYSLGSEFIDLHALAQTGLADWFRETFNEHVIEDWMDWNYGEESEAPELIYQRDEDPSLSVADLKSLIDGGVVTVDPELEEHIRERYKLPARSPSPVPGQAPPEVEAKRQRRTVRAAAGEELALPDRSLRRQPYAHEVAAAVDYAALDGVSTTDVEAMVAAWEKVQSKQIDKLATQISDAKGDITKLSALSLETEGSDLIHEKMAATTIFGAQSHLDEAKRQGRTIAMPDLDDVIESMKARAEASALLLARGLADAASRHAINKTGGSLDEDTVAGEVKATLSALSNAYLKERFTGLLTQALNTGRRAAMGVGKPNNIYASELLDENTCEECMDVDGTDYGPDLEAAEEDYPTGGYKDCLGGERCRGTLVATYDEEPANA